MRLRRSPAVIASVATLALLGACSSGGNETSDPTTTPPANGGSEEPTQLSGDLTFWVYPVIGDDPTHQAVWDDSIAGFKELHPDVNINIEIYPWANRDEAISTAIVSNTTPDGIYLIPDQLSTYADALEPMESLLSDEHLADILPNVVESITVNGNMLGAPILTSSNPMICNAEVFEAAGVTEYPSTWDDFLELGPVFKDAGFYLTDYQGSLEQSLNHSFYPYLWQAGGSVFNEDGSDVAFNSDAGREALEFIKTLVDNEWVERDSLTTIVAFEQTAVANNQVACVGISGSVTEVLPFWGEENIVVLDPLTKHETVAYGTVGSLSIFKGSNNKEAAAAFIEYVTSGDRLVEYLTTSKYFSALQSTGSLYADDPIYGPLEQTIPYSTVGELHPQAREIMGVISPEIQSVLLGNKSVEAALNDAASEAGYVIR